MPPVFLYEPTLTLLARPHFIEPAHLPVVWVGEGSDGERLSEFAGRLCYMSQHNPAKRSTRDYIENIKRQGHGSVLEHANYSVLVEGVSRSLTHELIRHRAGFGYCLGRGTLVYSEHGWGTVRNGTKKCRIEQLYEMTKTPQGRARLRLLRLRCLDEVSGTFATGQVAAIAHSGVKPVFRVELEDGKAITCTREHRFLTPSGWWSLDAIVGGIVVDGLGNVCVGQAGGVLLAAEDMARAAHASAVVGVELEMPAGARKPPPLPPPLGSAITWEIDQQEERPVPREIVRVTYIGKQETFDIEMEGPHHNFVANGLVTHNSQLSQRYVDESQACYVVPPAVIGSEALEAGWKGQIEEAQRTYVDLVEQLMERYGWVPDKVHRRKMAREAARSVLPNATETKIVVTGNARAWRTMLELRTGEGAELEIRRFAVACLRLLQGEAPGFFSDFEIYQAPDRREAARVIYHKV